MKLPPFKSMYLVKGTLTGAVIWFGAGLLITYASPVADVRDSIFFVSGLVAIPLWSWVYASIKRDEAARSSLITDHLLKDYERETLTAIRAASPWCERMPTKVLYDAWREWSTKTRSAGWLHPAPDTVRRFLSWAFTRPIDRF